MRRFHVFCATLATETNSFSPIPTTLDDYKNFAYFESGEHPDSGPTMFTAPLWESRKRADKYDWRVTEGLCAAALPGGLTTEETYIHLKSRLLDDLQRALPVDAVVLGLHGAMMAEGQRDCEGDLLETIRKITGPETTIAASLDPHCHLSDRMLRNANVLVSFKEYPHTDVELRATELVSLVARTLRNEVNPIHHVIDCGMIAMFYTDLAPVRTLVDKMRAWEHVPGVLSVSLIHGFSSGDTEDMGTRVLVYTGDDPALAKEVAEDIAKRVVELRGQTEAPRVSIDEAVELAQAPSARPLVIADGADNPGGGAPGDSTHMLAALLQAGVQNVAAGPIWDPAAVDLLTRWGEGATVRIRVGGKTCLESGSPVDVEAEVTAVRRDFSQRFAGSYWPLGDVVAIRQGSLDIVLSNVRNQCFVRDVFEDLGIDLPGKTAVVVKSNQHFFESFKSLTDRIVYLAAPGINAIDPRLASYKYADKSIWPLADAQ